MFRHLSEPRAGWRRTVKDQGLVWAETRRPDGSAAPYWDESAMYEFSEAEITELESATETLHDMCHSVLRRVFSEGPSVLRRFALPERAFDYLKSSYDAKEPSLYGRFDLAYDGVTPPKLLEFNGDTPTGLLETSVIQWYWLEDMMPSTDQWNSVHERLVAAWRTLRRPRVHFAHLGEESTGEEWMTVAYLRDTAQEAGIETFGIEVEQIGWDSGRRVFVGLDGEPIYTCFKLYPWEAMLAEPFGERVLEFPSACRWIEPAWKALLSNKALLVLLWELFPDHPNLLPSYAEQGPLTSYARKPLHGREGAGISIVSDTVTVQPADNSYGAEGYVYQQYVDLPRFDGRYVVLGSWVIDGQPAGCLVRESDGPVTDYYSRVVPHIIATPRPDTETRQAWLAEP
jgi:glutathionylspermidine synthase